MSKLQDSSSKRAIIIAFAFISLFFDTPVSLLKAQYSFSALQGTFLPLIDATSVSSIQKYSSMSGTIDLGFTFKYNGQPYNRIKASASGFITFKKAAKWNEMDSSVIAPLGYNALSGEKGNASYKTEGTAPNRVFTFEWLNWLWDWDAARSCISFQVKLYETSNRIEFYYRKEAGELNNPIARIGLIYQYPGKCLFLSDVSDKPVAVPNQVFYVYQSPAPDFIYRFDEAVLTEPDNHVTNFKNILQGKVSLQWTDSRGLNLPQRYLILVSDQSFEDVKIPADGEEIEKDLNLNDGDGAVYVDYGTQKFEEFTKLKVNSTYFFKIFPVNNYFTYANYKTNGEVAKLKINTSIDLSTIDVNIAGSVLLNTSSDIQYSINSADGVNGSWVDCDPVKTIVDYKTGGFDLWVRQKSNFNNNLKLMTVAPQRAAPSFTINFISVATNENIPANVEYSSAQNMSPVTPGNGLPISLEPGSTMYFRLSATKTEVASEILVLTVPDRPSTPSFTIDYNFETTQQVINNSVEYSFLSDMSNAVSGFGESLNLTPGKTVYFRIKPTPNSFYSGIQALSVPERHSIPVFTIDFKAESTSQIFSMDYEYSYLLDFSNSISGAGVPLEIIPGKNLFIRQKANTEFFRSESQNLLVPDRPQAPTAIKIDDDANTFDWEFAGDYTEYSYYEYSVDSGKNWKICTSKPVNVGNLNLGRGELKLRVKATSSSFSGNMAQSDVAFTMNTGVPALEDAGIRWYPNPVNNVLYLENLPGKSTVRIVNARGRILFQESTDKVGVGIPMDRLSPGMFFIQVISPNGQYQSSFMKL